MIQPRRLSRVVALQALIDFGAADEPEELPGAAHLLEHLLLSESARTTLLALGGTGGTFTTYDLTVLHLSLASRYFDAGLQLLAGALLEPDGLRPDGERVFQKAVAAVQAELRQAADTPARVLAQALWRTAFPLHPYGRPVLGTLRGVQHADRARLAELLRRHYGAGRVTLVLCGDLPADARARVTQALSGLRRGPGRPRRTVEPPQDQPRAVALFDDRDNDLLPPQSPLPRGGGARIEPKGRLLFGFRLPPLSADEAAALDLAAVLLGHGEGHAYRHTGREPGLFVAEAGALPEGQLAEAAQAALTEILRFGQEEVPQAELSRAKNVLAQDAARRQETAAGQAFYLGYLAAIGGPAGAEYERAVEQMGPARLREILSRLLVPLRLTVAALLPRASEPAPRGRAQLLLSAVSPRDPAQARRLLLQVVERARLREAAPERSGPAARLAGQVLVRRLKSGVKLLILPDPAAPVVALQALWPGGQRHEDERTAGASQLLVRLLPHGARDLEGTVRGVAGPSTFGLRLLVLPRDWERGLSRLAACLRDPAFTDADVEAERRRLLIEIGEKEDDLTQAAHRLFLRALYPRHPYRLDPLGTPQSVAALTRRRLSEFYRRRYPTGRLTLAVVGAVDPAQVIRRAEALLPPADPHSAPLPEPRTDPDPPPAEPVQIIKYAGQQQAHITAGFRGVTLSDPERPVLLLLTAILQVRLSAELRDKRGLVYRAEAQSVEGADPGYLAIHLATSPDKAEAAQVALRDELRRLADHPVPAEELLRARRHLIGAHELAQERRGDLALALALSETCGPGWAKTSQFAEQVERATPADVQRAAQKYLDERHAVLAAVLPESKTPAALRRTVRETGPEERPAAPQAAARKRKP